MAVLGRERECAVLDRFLDAARAGRGGSLVLRGVAGIGKTALLEYAVARAADLQVAVAAGVEAEAELGYAALHRLLRPFLDGLDRLPDPQRDGLGAAFGLRAGPPPNRFLVGLATLTLLSAAAADRPLFVVCDDAHWLDRESVDVLALVGRRLDADALALLFTTRAPDGGDPLAGLPELEVGELAPQAASALLATTLQGAVDGVVLPRILAGTGGNPLAIQEVARALRAERRVSDRAVEDVVQGEPLPLDRRMQDRFAGQARQLDPLTRTALLVVAADGTGDRDLVRRAVVALDDVSPNQVAAAVEEAVQATLLVILPGGALGFRHPLIRSAVYGDARPDRRRLVHAALADATDPADVDRRAWHRGAAALPPDEVAAGELEQAAARARARGGFLSQAAFLARAAELTAVGARRNGRLIAAAVAALTAGAPHRAGALLATLTTGADAPDQDAAAVKLRANLANLLGRDRVVPLLLEAVHTLSDRNVPAARDTLLEALAAVTITKQLGDGLSASDVARAALDGGPLPPDPGPADLLRVGHATLVAVGHGRAAPILRRALAAGPAQGPGNRGAACLLGVVAALELWDIDALGRLAGGYTALARGEGALRLLQIATYQVALHQVLCGRLAEAEETFTGYREVLVAISGDRDLFVANDVLLRAWRGDRARTDAAVAVQAGPPVDRPAPAIAQLARWAAMVLAAGEGRSADAREIGRLVFAEDPPHLLGLVLPDLVEAAVRTGDRDTADRALAQLAVRAEASGTPWALGLLARSRALLARPGDAEALFTEAVTQLGKTPVVTDLARAHLGYGEWLRRQRRRTGAREQLRTAHRLFDEMGAPAFAERARLELLATGERARSRTVPAGPELTPQEARIARLAAGGATNVEIASALFLSRTRSSTTCARCSGSST